MEYEKIKQLMDDMGNSKLTSIQIEFPDGTRINMEKNITKETLIVDNKETVIDNNSKENTRDEKQNIAFAVNVYNVHDLSGL